MSILAIIEKMMAAPVAVAPPPGPTPEVIGEFITDLFPGPALSSEWSAPGGQTITVGTGLVNIVGSGSSKDVTKTIKNVGYGQSTYRNYEVWIVFKMNSRTTNSKGIYVGVESNLNNTQLFSTYALFDFSTSTGNLLQVVAADNLGAISSVASSSTGLPAITTTDDYMLKLTVSGPTATARLEKMTGTGTGDFKEVSFTYNFSPYSPPLRPNIFYYSFGVAGSSDVDVRSFHASTQQKRYPKILFLGDSITVGYSADSPLNSYAEKLKLRTTDDVQILAGAGNSIFNTIDNLPEILDMAPEIIFLYIGTNTGGGSYTDLVDALENEGITVYKLLVGNGGNPATGGTFNNMIATNYPTSYVDLWALLQTMSIGSGDMVDSLHPSLQGHGKIDEFLATEFPTIFPL